MKSPPRPGAGVRETLEQGQRVLQLQSQYNEAYETVLDAMREGKIHILNEEEYSDAQREFATNYFKQRIRAHLVPILIERPFPDLKDGVVYFVPL